MKQTLLFSIIFAILIALCSACTRQQKKKSTVESTLRSRHAHPPPDTPTISPTIRGFVQDYDRYFSGTFHAAQMPGAAVVIVKDSQIVFLKGYGVKIKGKPEHIDSHTVFRIGSLSKGFAGVLTGVLVQKGYLKWDDPVKKYCPKFTLRDPKQAQRITIKHLLSHTTGLPYHAFTNLIEDGQSLQKIMTDYLPKSKVYGKEGVFYSYQNVAFCIIQEVMKEATGKSYEQLLHEYIFQPALMTDASCSFQAINAKEDKTLPHFQTGYGWAAENISPLYYGFAAAGGVNASISDMGNWLKVLLGHQNNIVSEQTLDDVFRPVVQTDKERRILPGWIARNEAAYSMGWRVLTPETDTILYHSGYVNGYQGEIALDRKEGIGICVLFNAKGPVGSASIPEFFRMYKRKG